MLESAVTRYPKHAAAWVHVGLARLESGDPAGAEQALHRAEQCQPTNPAWPVFLALARLDQGDPAGAAQHLQEALQRDGGNVLAHQLGYLCQVCKGETLAGLEGLNAEPAVLGNGYLVERLMVELEKILVDTDEPAPLFDTQEEDVPMDGHGTAGEPMAESGAMLTPIEPIESPPEAAGEPASPEAMNPADATSEPAPAPAVPAEPLPPYFTKTPRSLVESLLVSNMLSDMRARSVFTQAQRLVDKVVGYRRVDFDESLAKNEELLKAIQLFEEALTLDPSLSRGFYFLGEACFLVRQYKLSRQALERSILDDKANFMNLYYLGRIDRIEGDMASAKLHLGESVGMFEKLPEGLLALGQIAVREQEWTPARDYLRRAALLDMALVKERLVKAIQRLSPEAVSGVAGDPAASNP